MQTTSFRPHRLVLIGKLVIVLAGAVIAGQAYHRSVVVDNEKYRTLTVDEYTAGFDDYRAGLQQDEWPLWGHVILLTIMLLGFFALYELLGHGVGFLLQLLMPRLSDELHGPSPGP